MCFFYTIIMLLSVFIFVMFCGLKQNHQTYIIVDFLHLFFCFIFQMEQGGLGVWNVWTAVTSGKGSAGLNSMIWMAKRIKAVLSPLVGKTSNMSEKPEI